VLAGVRIHVAEAQVLAELAGVLLERDEEIADADRAAALLDLGRGVP
jgi:hypothetical protein